VERELRWRTGVSTIDGSSITVARRVGRRLALPIGTVDYGDVSEEAVSATSNRLHEARALDRISEHFTNLADCLVEAMIKIHDRVRPESVPQFVAGHHFSRSSSIASN